MQKVELSKVLDLLIAEDHKEAGNLLHEWFVGKSKAILEDLMQEDDDALDGIEADKDEIESEEYYGDSDLTEEGDDEAGMVGAETDLDNAEMDAEFDGDAAADLGDEMGVEEVPVEDKVEDLEAQLASLRAEFDKIMGAEQAAEVDAEAGIEGDVEGDVEGEDMFGESEELSEDDFQDLEESFELEKVKEPDMSEGSLAGDGGKTSVDKTSPIPQKKPEARVGGAAVEMKGPTHKGYSREASPGVNTKPILKNQVSNAKQDLAPVKQPEGDKSALLNKGPAPDKGKSPIGGGAVDLRGNDMKRKK